MQKEAASPGPITKKIPETMTGFCKKYIVSMEALYTARELNQWCCSYSAGTKNTEHREPEKMLYHGFMQEAYGLGIMPEVLSRKPSSAYSLRAVSKGAETDLLYGICMEIRRDYSCPGFLIHAAMGQGHLYRICRSMGEMHRCTSSARTS